MLKRLAAVVIFALTVFVAARAFDTFSGGGWGDVAARIGAIPAATWLLLAALTAAFYLLDWIRFRSVLAVFGHRLRARDGIQLTCVSYFATSLTPSSELHLPAMMYMLTRRGVPAADAFAATTTKSIVMTLWICAVSWLLLTIGPPVVLPPAVRAALPFVATPLVVIVLGLALVAFHPGAVARWAQRLLLGAGRPAPWRAKLVRGIARAAEAMATIADAPGGHLRRCHLASLVFLLVYVAIGWVLAEALGFRLGPIEALTVFSTSLMVEYLAPVPGAIGVAEVATSYMLDPHLTASGMAVAAVLRLLCWYGVAIPGALVLLSALLRDRGHPTAATPSGSMPPPPTPAAAPSRPD